MIVTTSLAAASVSGGRLLTGGEPQAAAGDFLDRCPVFHAHADTPPSGSVASGNAIATSSRMERVQNND